MTTLEYRLGPYGQTGTCRLDVYGTAAQPVAIVTDLRTGLSVTNGAEDIHRRLVDAYGPEVLHIEHYERRGRSPEHWDAVTVNEQGHARWTAITAGEVARLVRPATTPTV